MSLPYPGPNKVDCPDGCGLFGAPTRNGHVKGCPCNSCRGRRSRARGQRKQRAARKALGIPGLSLGADHEELWRGVVRVEVKSGARDAGPIDTRYRAWRKQSDASHAFGDNRPFAGIAMPPGMSDGYAIVRLSDALAFAYALVEEDQASRK
jgi:hypothetical protein